MRILLYIAFLLTYTCVWGQRPYVELIVTPNVVELNQPFNVTVKSNIQGENINIDLPEAFQDGHSVMNRMESEYDVNTRELVTFLYYSKSGSLNKSGKFTFGPAYVKKGNKVYRSNKVVVEVKEYMAPKEEDLSANVLRKPAAGQIICSKKECYEGEAVCVQAQVISKFNPTHYESYDTYQCAPITEEHEIDNARQITVRLEDYGRYERFVFELDKKVIFPQKAGKVVVEPFEMMLQSGFDSYPLQSSRAVIVVKKLPENAPKSFCGLVGEAKLTCDAKKVKCMKGDVVTYEVTLDGVGNLQDVSKPKLRLKQGFELYGDPEVKEKFGFGETGAKGCITWKYFLKCNQVGSFDSPEVEMAFFHPKEEKYKVLKSTTAEWEILENPVLDPSSSTSSEVLVMEKYGEDNNTSPAKVSDLVKWIGYSSPLCLAFLFLLFRKKKSKKENDEPEISQSAEIENVEKVDPLTELKAQMPHLTVEEFLSNAVHCMDNLLSIHLKGEPGWTISTEEINDAALKGQLSEEQVFGMKYLKSLSDNCRYGGLSVDLSKEEILQKVENLKIH